MLKADHNFLPLYPPVVLVASISFLISPHHQPSGLNQRVAGALSICMHEYADPDLLGSILSSYSGYSEFSFGSETDSLDSDTSDFAQYSQANAANIYCFLGLRFNSKDGGSIFFRNVCELL
jgi:hypothetical protein